MSNLNQVLGTFFFMVLTKAAFIWSKMGIIVKKCFYVIYFIIMQFIPILQSWIFSITLCPFKNIYTVYINLKVLNSSVY